MDAGIEAAIDRSFAFAVGGQVSLKALHAKTDIQTGDSTRVNWADRVTLYPVS